MGEYLSFLQYSITLTAFEGGDDTAKVGREWALFTCHRVAWLAAKTLLEDPSGGQLISQCRNIQDEEYHSKNAQLVPQQLFSRIEHSGRLWLVQATLNGTFATLGGETFPIARFTRDQPLWKNHNGHVLELAMMFSANRGSIRFGGTEAGRCLSSGCTHTIPNSFKKKTFEECMTDD
jgi:hypothetical protein